MPHQVIEYSANIERDVDIGALLRAMHESAMSLEALPTPGIRTRAARRDRYRIADGHPDNAFINVTLRIARGRSDAEKQLAGETLFGTLKAFVQDAYERRPILLSLEIQEIEPATRWKHSNIRDFIAEREAALRATDES